MKTTKSSMNGTYTEKEWQLIELQEIREGILKGIVMKYYSREITKREKINSFGRLGYVLITEYVKTNEIENYNKGKKIKFDETDAARKFLYRGKETDKVYEVKGEIVSRKASGYRW